MRKCIPISINDLLMILNMAYIIQRSFPASAPISRQAREIVRTIKHYMTPDAWEAWEIVQEVLKMKGGAA